MAYSANQWQPVHVPGPGEPEVSPPPSRDGGSNSSNSGLKRFGTPFSWKGWTKASKSTIDSDKSRPFLPSASRQSRFRSLFTPSPLNTQAACNHGWKPYTMRKRVLVPMAIWTLALAAVIEFLAQKSGREGGLALTPAAKDISDLARFSSEFLPTIIAVVFSIAWTWVDLDVKRIQPWLELSREDGAAVKDSLVLDYPYDFVAFAPFKAAKRR